MFVCKKIISLMLIIVLCGTVFDTFCMVGLANSGWQKVKESPYTPYALSPVAGYAGAKVMDLSWKIAEQLGKSQLHVGVGLPLAVGIGSAAVAIAAVPSFALTEMLRKQREPHLLAGNLSLWQFYYPTIIQGLTLGLPFAYYLAKKENHFPSILTATLIATMVPGFVAGTFSAEKEERRLHELRQEQRQRDLALRQQQQAEQRRRREAREEAEERLRIYGQHLQQFREGERRRQEEERDKLMRKIGREALEQQMLSRREEERLNRERLQKELERNNNRLTQEEQEKRDEPVFRTEDIGNN